MEDFVCKICGYESNGKLGLVSHVSNLHKIDFLEYAEKYEGFQIPKCPICGKNCKHRRGLEFSITCGEDGCKKKSIKKTSLEKYGVDHPGKSESIRNKTKKTNLERYGVDNPWKNKAIQEKRKETWKKLHNGADNPKKDEKVRNKAMETCKKNHGVEFPLQSSEILESMKKKNIEKTGYAFPLQNPETLDKLKKTNLEKYGNECSLLSPEVKDKSDRTNTERYGCDNYFKSTENQKEISKRRLEQTGFSNPGQDPEVREKMAKTYWDKTGYRNPFLNPSVVEKIRTNVHEKYGVWHTSQIPEVHKKQMAHRRAKKDGFDSLAEKKLAELLTNRGVDYRVHYRENGKEWDFAVFKDGVLKCLIEVDGEYNHGLLLDSDGKHVQGEKDCERFGLVPEGVNFIAVDSRMVTEENIAAIMETIGIDYEDFIKDILLSLPADFPYPGFPEDRMRKDWERLRKYEPSSKHRLGLSIIQNFHKSIWSGRVGNYPSPVEAWSDRGLLEKCVRNRFIYKSNLSSRNIADGFNVCKIAPKVSVFNPSLARYILAKYCSEAKTVLDPFSGFSGRMLGACSLGLSYTGYDLDQTHVDESNRIVEFLGLDAVVKKKDILEETGSADVLFTCPPYGNKETWGGEKQTKTCEQWIEECLNRFDCRKYVFVVDSSYGKYADNVVETLENKSHFSSSKEYIVVALSTQRGLPT